MDAVDGLDYSFEMFWGSDEIAYISHHVKGAVLVLLPKLDFHFGLTPQPLKLLEHVG